MGKGNKSNLAKWLWVTAILLAVLLPMIAFFVDIPLLPPVFALIIGVLGAVIGWMSVSDNELGLSIGLATLFIVVGSGLGVVSFGEEMVNGFVNAILGGLATVLIPAGVVAAIRAANKVYGK